jgi:hypothetical protein
VRRRRGFVELLQPPLTQTLGPWVAPGEGKYAQRLDHEKRVLRALIARLPRFDRFEQNLAPAITNGLPFHWAGFTLRVRYTYRIEDLADLDLVWSEFDADVRAQVRGAEAALEVRDDAPFETFVELHRRTLERAHVRVGYGAETLWRIERACSARGARKLLVAFDPRGRPHAGIYVVHDGRCAYYLLGGRDEAVARRGATALLVWRALQQLAPHTHAFDFEGSMVESIERFFRSFGARQTMYLNVTSVKPRLRGVLAARDLARALAGR